MILRHPGYDLAIVVCNALVTDGSLFLLALSAFSCCVFAMAATTGLAHFEGIVWREIFAASFYGASAEGRGGGSEGGRRLKVDVIWVVAHPDAAVPVLVLVFRTQNRARPSLTTAPTAFPPSEL